MTKRLFWKVFWPIWNQAFLIKNINSGFAKTDIWPLNPSKILDKITFPPIAEANNAPHRLKTPLTYRAVHRFQKLYKKDPDLNKLDKLFKANLYLSAQYAIDRHIKEGLIETIKNKKKKRQRGKHMNLLGEEESGPQFFSPTHIQAARDYQEIKEAEKAQQQQETANRKAAAKEKKKEKEEIAAQRRIEQAGAQADQAANKQLMQDAKEATAELKKLQLATKGAKERPKKAPPQRKSHTKITTAQDPPAEPEIMISGLSRTRTCVLPKQYND